LNIVLQRLLSYENAGGVLYGTTSQGVALEATPSGNAELATGVARMLMQLLDNLKIKARAYKNEALAALFMMNNVHYVQWTVETQFNSFAVVGHAMVGAPQGCGRGLGCQVP